MKTHLHGALRADRGQHEQQRGVRQPAWPERWAGLLLSARHHNKQPSPRVTPALPMSQGKDKEPVRRLPVRIKANRKKNKKQEKGWRTEPGSKGWERVGGQKNRHVQATAAWTRQITELQGRQPSVADTWTDGWEVATCQRGTLGIYGPLYASGAGPLGTGR